MRKVDRAILLDGLLLCVVLWVLVTFFRLGWVTAPAPLPRRDMELPGSYILISPDEKMTKVTLLDNGMFRHLTTDEKWWEPALRTWYLTKDGSVLELRWSDSSGVRKQILFTRRDRWGWSQDVGDWRLRRLR